MEKLELKKAGTDAELNTVLNFLMSPSKNLQLGVVFHMGN